MAVALQQLGLDVGLSGGRHQGLDLILGRFRRSHSCTMCRALCGRSHAGQEAEVEAFAPGEEAGRPAVTERSRPRPAGIGRLEPRLFTLDLLRSPAVRHKIQTSLNKGKASNNLRKAPRASAGPIA